MPSPGRLPSLSGAGGAIGEIVTSSGTMRVFGREQIIVTACAVLLTTLVLPSLTLPWLMKKLALAEIARVEREAEEVLAQLAQEASLSALRSSPVMASLSPAQRETIRSRLSHLSWDRSKEDADSTDQTHRLNAHDILVAAQTIAWTPPAAPDPESWTGCCGGWTCEPC